jgi:hypothetical protein
MVGAVAQLGEHLLCKQGVSGSIPLSSTKPLLERVWVFEVSGKILLEKKQVCGLPIGVRRLFLTTS